MQVIEEQPNRLAATFAPAKLTAQMLDEHIGRQPMQLPGPNPGKVRRAAMLATLTSWLYYVILAVIAVCVYALAFRTSPALSNTDTVTIRGFLLWFIPVFAGAAMIGLMIQAVRAQGYTVPVNALYIYRDREPLVHLLVESLARQTGAPMPRINFIAKPEIYMTVSGATPEETRYELYIGLPLVAGMTVRRLAGLIARELAFHRDDDAAKPLRRIREIDAWLHNLANYRSSFDQTMADITDDGNRYLKPLGLVTKYVRTLVGGMIKGIIVLTRAVTSSVAREQHLQADAAGAHVAGSKEYIGSVSAVELIGAACSLGAANLHRTLKLNLLPDNYPAFTATRIPLVPEEERRRAHEALNSMGKKKYDMEPTFAERLQHVMQLRAVGIIDIDSPASALFDDYEGVCREVTLMHYAETYGEAAGPALFIANEQFYERCAPELSMGMIDESMIDYLEGDKLAIFLRKFGYIGGILLTASILGIAGFRLFGVVREATKPAVEHYRAHIGHGLSSEGQFRQVIDVKWFNEGEVMAEKTILSPKPVIAPESGWYYDLAGGLFRPCKGVEKAHFMNVYEPGRQTSEEE